MRVEPPNGTEEEERLELGFLLILPYYSLCHVTIWQKGLHQVGRVAQVVEHLPSKCKALSSNPSIPPPPQKKKKASLDIEQILAPCA
jgi:hypothetical protein